LVSSENEATGLAAYLWRGKLLKTYNKTGYVLALNL
jgi:hypothetical protein